MAARSFIAPVLACCFATSFATIFASGLACSTSDDGNADCVAGQSGCECTPDGLCDPGLACVAGTCEPSAEGSSGVGDGDPGTETGDGDGDPGDGDGDPNTTCHPLMIDCPQVGTTCTWDGVEFRCTQGEIAIGDSCVPDDPVCISGFCAPQAMVPNCPSTFCCAAFCNLDSPVCGQPGTSCIDYFPDGATTPEVGACLGP